MIAKQKSQDKIDAIINDDGYDKGNVVTLYRDSDTVITLSDHNPKGENFGTLRIFYNRRKDTTRTVTKGSILQDVPQSIFKNISKIIIDLTTSLSDITQETLLDIECTKVYSHSKHGIALFKSDIKLQKTTL